ncbi:MAG: TfuA-like protein [Myxococcales bacterium]
MSARKPSDRHAPLRLPEGLGKVRPPAAGRADLVVFLGPSLPAAEAQKLARCRVLPPARQGDLWRALALQPKVIAIIDGVFESVPSVWHHEILAALDAGVAVLGASSMGALRAAELWRQGMVGVGNIFRMYRDGELTDDAEVALLHAGPEVGFEAFTVPLVNVRHNAERARKAKVLSSGEAKALVKAGQAEFFQDRTWDRVLEAARLAPKTRQRWDAWAKRRGLEDLKALDARACLKAAEALLKSGKRPALGNRARPSSLVRRRRLREGATLRDGGSLVRNQEILQALERRPDAGELTICGAAHSAAGRLGERAGPHGHGR